MASLASELERPRAGAGRQSTNTVVMVRPAAFGANAETRGSNAFQARHAAGAEVAAAARDEFDRAVATLRAAGITVIVLDDPLAPAKPDAVFPNNWFSTHADGRVVIYPMHAPNRRPERRHDLVPVLSGHGFRCGSLVDLSDQEREGRFLEGTGSLVLDRVSRVAYACRSPRTDQRLLEHWGRELGYRVVAFDAVDGAGRPVYHTNVVLSLGTGWALACFESIVDPAQRAAVAAELAANDREVIAFTLMQLSEFVGNALELATAAGGRAIALSERARRALSPDQAARLARHGPLIDCSIPTIEDVGGGSLRCMLAEIFLPRGDRPDA